VIDNNIETPSLSNLGDTILSPPWTSGGYWDGSTSELGIIDGEVTHDGYGGDIYLYTEAIELGHASVYGYITHHPDPYYAAPYDGYYDFTLTYEYSGSFDISVLRVPPYSDAFVEAEIVISFTMRVMSSSHVYEKEITLAEDVWREDEYIDWSNIEDKSFNDIYVTEGTEVFFSATMYVENMHATAGTVSPAIPAYAKGVIDISGSLLKIKIKEPAPPNQPPNKPSSPSPSNDATGVSPTTDLSWSCSDPDSGDTLTYDVYFEKDDSTPDEKVSEGQSGTSYDPGSLSTTTDYYWKIVVYDNHGHSTTGDIWEFQTGKGKSRINSLNVFENIVGRFSQNLFPQLRSLLKL
jgi:hypothetical protein